MFVIAFAFVWVALVSDDFVVGVVIVRAIVRVLVCYYCTDIVNVIVIGFVIVVARVRRYMCWCCFQLGRS